MFFKDVNVFIWMNFDGTHYHGYHNNVVYLSLTMYTREKSAFDGISLALRGSGAFGGGKTKEIGAAGGAPHEAAESAAFGGVKKKISFPTAPQMVLKTLPVP